MTQPFDNRDWDQRQIAEKDAEIERWKAQHEEFLLKHAREQGAAFELMDKALGEIKRLKEDRDKWEYECKIAYSAFAESNVKKFYEETHQEDIAEHNRMMHEIAVLKSLLTRAADALESNQIATSTSCEIFTLIAELRKAAE